MVYIVKQREFIDAGYNGEPNSKGVWELRREGVTILARPFANSTKNLRILGAEGRDGTAYSGKEIADMKPTSLKDLTEKLIRDLDTLGPRGPTDSDTLGPRGPTKTFPLLFP